MAASLWPKQIAPLTPLQQAISDDFMKTWLELLPRRYRLIDRFNHRYPVKHAPSDFRRTLEIGAGLGEHLEYEQLTSIQKANYHALDIRPTIAAELARRCPEIKVITGDCQQRLHYPDEYFDRILAIHVLEHLPNLPSCLEEMYRLCDKQRGIFSVVIPCEGSLAYWLARRISAQRLFEKKYKQSYRWFIEREHINRPHEILNELKRFFILSHRSFFPLPIPAVWCNLVIGLTLRPKPRKRQTIQVAA